MHSSEIKADVCIVGHGIAGGSAALVCADNGLKVVLVTASGNLTETSTYEAQGGIVFDHLSTPEDRSLLIQDIIVAGDGINYRPAVEKLVSCGASAIEFMLIDRLGVEFDQDMTGKLDLIREGAHSKARIAHQKDRTGLGIQTAFNVALKSHPNITLLSEHTAIDLLTNAHHAKEIQDRFGQVEVLGCYAFDHHRRDVKTIHATYTVLATGGCGQVFRHTTNPLYSRGDGVAMAYRAGARVMNLEYIQFHPSAFFHQGKARFLLTEALRGHGAILRNEKGQSFMREYHALKDLAPRDVVSRAIYKEIAGSKQSCVYLDMTHLSKDDLIARFPFIYKECLKYGRDPTTDLIPVFPAAHYMCGGIWADMEGQSSLYRLYGVGEVACTGVHGANRLASTSLLEGLVWGVEAGKDIVSRSKLETHRHIPVNPWITSTEAADPALVQQDWKTLKHTMMNYVGVVRTQNRFDRASEMLPQFQEQIERFYRRTELSDELIGLRNATLCATLIFNHARRNPLSRGCHYTEA